MDLIRKLLLYLEDTNSYNREYPIRIVGYGQDEIGYHSYLLVDAGLATGIDTTTLDYGESEYQLTGLTWNGHEFLDAARDETNWNKAKTIFTAMGGFSLPLLLELLLKYVREQIGIPG